MDKLSYHRHRYPSIVIQQAIWLYFRFSLSYRDVEDMLAERGIDVSYETVRRWALKFGAIIARKLPPGWRNDRRLCLADGNSHRLKPYHRFVRLPPPQRSGPLDQT